MNYRIYRNLRKKCYSIQGKVNGRWKVIKHGNDFVAQNCVFKVSEAGRQRVLRTKRKNVHAFVVCEDVMKNYAFSLDGFPAVCYDPYSAPTFTKDGQPIHSAELLFMGAKGVKILC